MVLDNETKHAILQCIAMGRYGAGTREDDGRWYGDYGRKRGWTSKPCGWNWLDIFWKFWIRLEYVIIPEGTTASTLTLACQLRYCMLTVSSVWAVTPHELLVLPFLEINLFNKHQTKLTWILTLAVHNGRHVACASGFSSLMPPVLGLLCHRVVAANDC